MVEKKSKKKNNRSYPEFWDNFIPAAVLLITVIILFLVYITARVALGYPAF